MKGVSEKLIENMAMDIWRTDIVDLDESRQLARKLVEKGYGKQSKAAPAQGLECNAEHCAYNPDGICKFSLVYGRKPVLHDDGCDDFCYKED